MKNISLIIYLTLTTSVFAKPEFPIVQNPSFVIQMVALDGNNINAWIINTGIFNQDLRVTNTPGFEWPKNTGSFAIFTTGINIAAKVDGVLKEATASYKGEYTPGYIIDSAGQPVARTDSRFKIYSVRSTDNWISNSDWLNWGLMVPYGAPFVDINHNGVYEPVIDTPGIRGASQTIFVCLTDGFPETHQLGEGCGGGTTPLYAEVHMTAWCYDNPTIQDVQFIKWVIINKSHSDWNSTYIAVVSDPDLGCANDDYIGCDSIRQLGYCYNGETIDCQGSYRYPGFPPAVGFEWLNCSGASNINMKSFIYYHTHSAVCEEDVNGEPLSAYNYMKGYKADSTPYVIPQTSPPQTTKLCFSGDPETNTGWTEFKGKINNCGGSLYGQYVVPAPMWDAHFVMGSGADNFTVHPGDTQNVMIAQLIAEGTSNLNSVTKLKILADTVKAFCSRGFVIGTEQISSSIPGRFALYQNYPNPFNPKTKIKFSIPPNEGGKGDGSSEDLVSLKIFNVLGREIATLVKDKLNPGTYEVIWNANDYPSGVYFYELIAGDFEQTRKMVLLK